MAMADCANESQIGDWFRGRHVFVTGATGFMGKVLVEKLLRSCPGISNIYLLMRNKRGSCDVRSRLDEMLNASIFDWLRQERPDSLNKLVPILGDITLPGLGISAANHKLVTSEVSVVFHSAATVKFDEALKLSVSMNVVGTKRLVQLCHQMKKLEALVHVSTAYCNCQRQDVSEIVYPPPADPEKIIQCVDWMDDDMLNTLTPKLLGNLPNTYTFTKALAEHVLIEQSKGLPVAIVRPSIVTAAWQQPIPGWVDNLNGPTGLIAGAGKGVLRTILCHRKLIADLIPVDLAINLLITVAWHTATTRPNNILVYHCTTGALNPIRWWEIEELGHEFILKHPLNDILWYPGGSFKSNRVLNNICVLTFHLVPAFILDAVARIAGRPPIMMKIQRKLRRAVGCLEFFTTREWLFTGGNVTRLHHRLSPRDRKEFNFDVTGLVWRDYMEQYVLGTRKFVMKEEPASFPSARTRLYKMYWIHRLSQLFLLYVSWRVIASRSDLAKSAVLGIVGLLFQMIRAFRTLVPGLHIA